METKERDTSRSRKKTKHSEKPKSKGIYYTNRIPGKIGNGVEVKVLSIKKVKRTITEGQTLEYYKIRTLKKGGIEKEVKAVRVPPISYLLRTYWLFVFAFFALAAVYLVVFPQYAIFILGSWTAIAVVFEPWKTRERMEKTTKGVHAAIIAFFLFAGYEVYAHIGGDYNELLKILEGLFYGILLVYASLPLMGILRKYSELYALEIDNPKDWYLASYYIWRRYY